MLLPLDVPLYRLTPIHPAGTPEQFYEASDARLAEVLLRVVEFEAPVHFSEAARRVAAHWEIARVGNRIRERVETVVHALSRQHRIRLDGNFLRLPGHAATPVRSRDIPGYSFDPEFICPDEFEQAVLLVLRHAGAQMTAELVTEVCRLMGFDRAGRKLSEQVNAAVQRLVEAGKVRPGSVGLQAVE